MTSKPFKSGTKINLSIGDVSFKGVIKRQSKGDDLQKAEILSEWKNAVKDLEVGCECVLTCEAEDQTFMQYKMILLEKELDQTSPVLLLKPYQELGKRGDLRKHERIKAFVFANLSAKDGLDRETDKEKALSGTISDISVGGCLLMSDHSFKIDDYLLLVFTVSDNNAQIKVKAQIKNLRRTHIEECFFYGLEFVELDNAGQETIKSYTENSK